jgi:hypothetical protein
MEFLGPGYLGWDGVSTLPKLDAASIKKIVTDKLIVSYAEVNTTPYTNNFGVDHTHHLRARLARFGSADSELLTQHFAQLPKKLPAFLITHFIKLVCGALNSDGGRRRKFDPDGSVHPDKCPSNPFPCYLCGLGDVSLPGDCGRHLFGSCGRVRAAWDGVLNNYRFPRDESWIFIHDKKVSPLFVTDYPLADSSAGYSRLAITMAFCWATHRSIDQIKAGRCAVGADARIVSLTMSLRSIWAPIKKKKHRS